MVTVSDLVTVSDFFAKCFNMHALWLFPLCHICARKDSEECNSSLQISKSLKHTAVTRKISFLSIDNSFKNPIDFALVIFSTKTSFVNQEKLEKVKP